MNRLTTFLLGVVVGVAGLFASENYYIIRSDESLHVVRKVASKLEFPYRDIRHYTVEDWQNQPSLALAIVKSEKQQLLIDSGLSDMQRQLEGFLQSLRGE